ncbi:hypothetical protein, partial [Paraburkholderia acidipaludis]|uniref:hypothetical protein n=1 Tax=Paraburkholderia acidipaludis TaxID=660537 RepID=UPI001C3F2F7E
FSRLRDRIRSASSRACVNPAAGRPQSRSSDTKACSVFLSISTGIYLPASTPQAHPSRHRIRAEHGVPHQSWTTNEKAAGNATFIARLLPLDVPPCLDLSEITNKRAINQHIQPRPTPTSSERGKTLR